MKDLIFVCTCGEKVFYYQQSSKKVEEIKEELERFNIRMYMWREGFLLSIVVQKKEIKEELKNQFSLIF